MTPQEWFAKSNKVQKLRRLATSPNPHEAAGAQAQAAKLQAELDRDPLDMGAVSLADLPAWEQAVQEMMTTMHTQFAVGERVVAESAARAKELDAKYLKRLGKRKVKGGRP